MGGIVDARLVGIDGVDRIVEEFEFIRCVPCDWERSIMLDGQIGDYIVMARQARNTDNWYIGAVTDEQARSTTITWGRLPRQGRLPSYHLPRCSPGRLANQPICYCDWHAIRPSPFRPADHQHGSRWRIRHPSRETELVILKNTISTPTQLSRAGCFFLLAQFFANEYIRLHQKIKYWARKLQFFSKILAYLK